MGKTLDKFFLLMWKNFLLQWRHPIQTLVEILAPVLFAVLLVVLRSLSTPVPHSAKLFTPFECTLFPLYNNDTYTIMWSPNTNSDLRSIMLSTEKAINNQSDAQIKLVSYSTSALLQEDVENMLQKKDLMAAVEFDDSLGERQTSLPSNLNVKIRFPSELGGRQSSAWFTQTWPTKFLYPGFQMHGPRDYNSNEGDFPGYNLEGFLILQKEISLSIIKQLDVDGTFERDKLDIVMQRFHYPKWTSDELIEVLQAFVGLIIMLSFVYTCITTVKVITNEKEKQLKEAMKIMGLPGWLHWTAWFLKTLTVLTIAVILMVILTTAKWYPNSDYTVFTYSNPFVIFLFLLLFVCATITYAFAISVFFSKANTAATVAGVVWFVSYSPYIFMQQQYDSLSLSQKLLSSLFSNTAVAYGFGLILKFEGLEAGIQWNNLWSPTNSDDSLVLGHLMIMLVVDAIIYMLIALYIETIFPGDYGIPQPFYFPFTKTYWCGNDVDITAENEIVENENYEREPTHLQAGIKVQNLSKKFSRETFAVDNLSLNMYQNQITVLLGHNGAGKTTTMSMLSGMLPPTSGTAFINGRNIRTEMEKIRDSYGLCPQQNILFDDLTVREHIYFYSKLKGMNKKEINGEIEKYITLLEFSSKEKTLSSKLSGGMKRKLSVAIAFCGNSKVVMCDEPTAGIDPGARRALWDLLVSQKKDRTIVLTTHFMDEADLLGDRIAIMSEGKLQCVGSSFFLKKRYGAGYKLIMDVSRDCNVAGITNDLQTFIPSIQVKSKIGSELTYILPEQYASLFESMLSNIENKSSNLGVLSYGISLTTLEEVFMKVGDIHRDVEDIPITDSTEELNGNLHNNTDIYSSKIPLETEHHLLDGWPLWRNQVMAMGMKKFLSYWRSWLLFLIQNAIPVVFVSLTIVLLKNSSAISELPSLKISLDSYNYPVTVLTTNDQKNVYAKSYIDLIKKQNHLLTNWENVPMGARMIEETENYTREVRARYLAGATFNDTINTITAWFNNNPYHTPPLTLQLVMNSILQAQTNLKDYFIQFYNHPLPFSVQSRFQNLNTNSNMGFQIAFNLGFSMAFVSAFYSMFTIRERATKAKHLQFVSGVKVLPFWTTAFVCDFLSFVFTSILIIITLVPFQVEDFKAASELGRVFSVLLVFGFCMIPFTYITSYMFVIPSTGFTRMSLINIFTGVAAMLIVQILMQPQLDLKTVGDALHWILLIVPHYSFSSAIRDLSSLSQIKRLCDKIKPTLPLTCSMFPQCCKPIPDYYDFKAPGIGRNVLFSCVAGVIFIVLQLAIEYGFFDKCANIMCNRKPPLVMQLEEPDDEDVLLEKGKVASLSTTDIQNYAVVMKDVSKSYSNFLAVNKLSLTIDKCECFGLLGVNGAGKTTTFKLLTGDIKFFSGDAWINGLNLRTNRNRINKFIGYCPQFDALLNDLTCKETLIMFGLIRGLRLEDCKYEAVKLAQDFDFMQHFDKKVKELSGGNKRKLSTSIALIGNPSVICLDEPTTGMDPATKRYLWNALCKIRDGGKCIVLTSHSMDECEALCTRLAIMVNGRFKCLGSTQRLKSKFSDGYLLSVKLKKTDSNEFLLNSIENFVANKFSNVVVREKHQELVTFFINDRSKPWSKMFGIMEEAKRELNIEDYSLGQNSLEQIFIAFTKQQRIVASSGN